MRSASNPADAFPPTSRKSRTPVHCACAKIEVSDNQSEAIPKVYNSSKADVGGTCWPDWIILHTQWGSFSSRRRLRYFALLLELKDRSGVVGYTVVIFSAHLVAVKWEFFTTSSTMEIQLCARPATQLTHSPYFRQIAYKSHTPVHCACAKI